MKKLLCRIFGHRCWAKITTREGKGVYIRTCERCDYQSIEDIKTNK